MYLVLLRHGEAGAISDSGQDSDRSLTERGAVDVWHSAKYLQDFIAEHGGRTVSVVHSPFRRTLQTAELVVEHFRSTNNDAVTGISADSQITPDVSPQEALASLRRQLAVALETSDMLIAVTHQPLISSLVGAYLDGDYRQRNYGHPSAVQALQPASLVVLGGEFLEPGSCGLKAQYHPHNDER